MTDDKLITFRGDSRSKLSKMAEADNRSLKALIEIQLEAMGQRGVSYTQLWQQCEAMTDELTKLSTKKIK